MTENNKNILIDTSSRVSNSYLEWKKGQSNILSPSAEFAKPIINCVNGQIIRYSIYVSTLVSAIYNIKVKDPLSTNLSFIPGTFYGFYYNPNWTVILLGTAKFNSAGSTVVDGKTVGGTIEWNIPSLLKNNAQIPYAAYLNFDCEVVYNLS